jgi:hypothetical protein
MEHQHTPLVVLPYCGSFAVGPMFETEPIGVIEALRRRGSNLTSPELWAVLTELSCILPLTEEPILIRLSHPPSSASFSRALCKSNDNPLRKVWSKRCAKRRSFLRIGR